jgi:hypothetical protein
MASVYYSHACTDRSHVMELNHIVSYIYSDRLLVREKVKIHRSHERVFNGLVVDVYTMWSNSIVPPLHGMDVSVTSNLTTNPLNTSSHGFFLSDKEPEIHCYYQSIEHSLVASVTSNLSLLIFQFLVRTFKVARDCPSNIGTVGVISTLHMKDDQLAKHCMHRCIDLGQREIHCKPDYM